MRALLIVALLSVTLNAACAATVYYVDLVNTAKSSVTSFAVAPAGSEDFREVPLGAAPLQGGGESTAIAIRNDESGCLRDLRTVFADGRVLIQQKFNVCKYRTYHTGQYLRSQDPPLMLAQP